MKLLDTTKHRGEFELLAASPSAQAAMMVLDPGESSGDAVENEHPKAEQWLFVVSGTGRARVGRRTVQLKPGSLLLVERGERHRVTGTGDEPLVTLNLYVPPAYTPGGDVRAAVRGGRRAGRPA